MADISLTTGESFYSGGWEGIQEIIRVLNIGEGKMSAVNQSMVNNFQEMIDRDIDSILNDAYQTPLRSYNMVQMASGGAPGTPAGSVSGSQSISIGTTSVVISGAGWTFIPTTVVVSVSMPAGGDNLFATVDVSSITSDGFTAYLSSECPAAGYALQYIVTAQAVAGAVDVNVGATVRVFPGDVRRAAKYWVAGQLLVSEFQQLAENITEQATQMVSDARLMVYAMSRPNHRIPGQRRKSTISRTMPAGLQPNAFPERPS
jgi:hypothetical protein